MKRILVTGGSGFIGSNLVRYLIQKGAEVNIVDNLITGRKENTDELRGKLFVQDVCKQLEFPAEIEKSDAVVHLAALTSVIDSNLSPSKTWHNNVESTFNMLEFCRENGIKRFVFASSSAVEGDSIYGATKITGEALCNSYRNFGIQTVCLRFSNVYGKFSSDEGVIPKFIDRLKNNQPIVVYGDGNQTRDFVNAKDICQAIWLALESKSGVFEVGTGIETSIKQLIELLDKVSGKSAVVNYHPIRSAEILNSVADISKSQKELGYNPEVSLEQGIREIWQERI